MTQHLPASTLILDYTIYPRHQIDEANARQIGQAIEAGEDLPPVIIDRKSLRVIDGFHRVTATLRHDPAAQIEVLRVGYANDGEMFLDAVKRNARHGVGLTSYDRARVVTIADEFKLTREAVAQALAQPLATLDKIKISRQAKTTDGRTIQVKRPLKRLAGTIVTPEHESVNRRSSGWSARFHANQITMLLDADLVDLEDETEREALNRLLDCLNRHMMPA